MTKFSELLTEYLQLREDAKEPDYDYFSRCARSDRLDELLQEMDDLIHGKEAK